MINSLYPLISTSRGGCEGNRKHSVPATATPPTSKGRHSASAIGVLFSFIDVGSAYTACVVLLFPLSTTKDLYSKLPCPSWCTHLASASWACPAGCVE
eukprot:1039797-Pelagomonas_calceolata.AAC.1